MIRGLQEIPLFMGISPIVLETLAEQCRTRQFQKDEVIFLQSDPADAVYVILEGAVDIVLTSPGGRELVINTMHRGDCFGELGLLTQKTHSADAIACIASQVLVIPKHAFEQALDNDPHLVRRLLEMIAVRLTTSSEREGALAFLNAHARLAKVLLDLDKQNNQLGYITIAQEELAQRSGLTRQTAAKLLGQWRRSGWLLTGRGRIMLLNRIGLRRIVQEEE